MTDAPEVHNETRGMVYVGSAYAFWGFVPLYWWYLRDVPAFEITLHRILWCSLVGLSVTAARGRISRFISVLRTPRIMGALMTSSLLITSNWTIYVYCANSQRLLEASMGYYMTPLVSIGLGVVLLGEKISRVRAVAIALATVAVAVQALSLGHFPWVAPALGLTFGFYGYVRKLTPVDSLDGLTIETCLLLPIAAPLLAMW